MLSYIILGANDIPHSERWRRWRQQRKGHVLGFGIGLAQGYATMGTIGFGDRFEYTAIGAVVNLAARLCADAGDGQILTNSRLAAVIGDIVEIDDLGDRALRGMSRPVTVVNLRALRS
jgi:adenylate cyclase